MNDSPEEKFNSDLWYVLQKIRKQSLYTVGGIPITYSIILGYFGSPTNDDEEAVVYKLNEWGMIELKKQLLPDRYGYEDGGQYIIPIEKILPRFKNIYTLYERALEQKIEHKRLYQLTQEFLRPMGRDKDLSFDLWQLTKKDEPKGGERNFQSLLGRNLTNIQLLYDFSTENRSMIKRLVDVLINQVEIKGFKPGAFGMTLSISSEVLQREGCTVQEATLLIDPINRTADSDFIKVVVPRASFSANDVMVPGLTLDRVVVERAGNYLTINLQSILALKEIKAHLETFERRIKESQSNGEIETKKIPEKKAEKNATKKENNIDEIYYNQKTAVGDLNGKEFRFKPESPASEVFSTLWGMIGTPQKRQDVLIASGFYEEGQEPDLARRSAETLHINNMAKAIRSALKIGPSKLINNDGNLTLLGKKLKSSKLNQPTPN